MLYDEYLKEAEEELLDIYGPDAMGNKLELFKRFFEDSTILSSMNKEKVVFTSASNLVTLNLQQAIMGAGIQKEGKLPIGRCFLTNKLDDPNMQNIIDEKLNQDMENLTLMMRGGKNYYGINRYIHKNPNSDPNAYEMVDVFTKYHNLVASGKKVPEDIKSDIDDMFQKRKQNFIENGIGLDSAAYRICKFCYETENLGEKPLPAVTIEAMKKIASTDLYSRQQIRDGEKPFDNVEEMEGVKNYFNASQILQPGFLDRFQNDLENIYHTAKENRAKDMQQQRD